MSLDYKTLLGKDNLKSLQRVLDTDRQSVLISSLSKSGIELAVDFFKDFIHTNKYELYEVAPDDKGKIRIDEIRQMLASTTTIPRNRRYLLIFEAETMLAGAQNALLKELEEPSRNCFFILLSKQSELLLPTIRSRTQRLNLTPISPPVIRSYFISQFPNVSERQISQIELIAGDDLSLWQELLGDDTKFTKYTEIATLAKEIVTSKDAYQRLKIIGRISKSERDKAIELATVVLRIYERLIKTSESPALVARTRGWLRALDNLNNNGTVRLNLALAVL